MMKTKETAEAWAELGLREEALFCLQALPGLLLDWYDAHARVLPWRSEPTPYRVYVSEIMLQQTRIETALPYFERFVRELPDFFALASVEDARLVKLWEGLGYYIRAHNLQKAAKIVVADFDGQLPASTEALRALPGVGEYTTGAVASIAFGIRVPAVDGNVLRVFARLLGCQADVTAPKVKTAFREIVSNCMSETRSGDFNQALMDLGATVCLPNGVPRCEICPLAVLCVAREEGNAQELPVKAAKKARRIEEKTVFVLQRNGRVFLRQRPADGLLPALWEFVNCMGKLNEKDAFGQAADWGFSPILSRTEKLRDAKHIFSHVEWNMRGYWMECGEQGVLDGVWATLSELREHYAVPGAFSAFVKEALIRLRDE